MALTDPLILPPDVLLLPARQLTAGERQRFGARLSDFALTRPPARPNSKIVSAAAATLLARFRTPTRVVDAVRAAGGAPTDDAERLLEEAFPVLAACYDAGLLVPAHSPAAREIQALFGRGDRIGPFEVVRSLRVLDDSEVYLARSDAGRPVVLKMLRPGRHSALALDLAHEAMILSGLRSKHTPRLVASGRHRRRQYLALSWCAGVPPEVAFGELRRSADRRRLLALAVKLLGAYQKLHAEGVLHGDIQPANLLIDAKGDVALLDFGSARRIRGRRPFPSRAGLAYYFEPELAAPLLERRRGPPTTLAGEQYALAALLYYLLTGAHYLDFQLEREPMLLQIIGDTPLPFSRRQAPPWPTVEAVLARALSKEPERRYASIATFRSALVRAGRSLPDSAPARAVSHGGSDFVARTLAEVDPSGALFRDGLGTAPSCSVWLGAAGVAYGLYRMASCRDDPRLLAQADLWLSKAEREAGRNEAFTGGEITPDVVGRVSMYHAPTGLYLVRALLANAVGDTELLRAAVERYVRAAESAEPPGLDLAFGRAGLLLGATILFEALPEGFESSEALLVAFAHLQLEAIWEELDAEGPMARGQAHPELGIAHGWGGILYSALRWGAASGEAPDRGLPARLAELAALGEEVGRGMRWRSSIPGVETMPGMDYVPGWCNGSAGLVHLWTAAATRYPREGFHDLAVRAGWNAWETTDGLIDLCCGATGRAYALLNLYRHTGDAAWLTRARSLHDGLVSGLARKRAAPSHPLSLYKGKTGLTLLSVDLDRPESAAMPLFESEGWPARARRLDG
jgi:serine/threonine-protein kinase